MTAPVPSPTPPPVPSPLPPRPVPAYATGAPKGGPAAPAAGVAAKLRESAERADAASRDLIARQPLAAVAAGAAAGALLGWLVKR